MGKFLLEVGTFESKKKLKTVLVFALFLLSFSGSFAQTCCINGICEKGEKFPFCPDCPCYNAMDSTGFARPFFYSPYTPFPIGKTAAQQNGMCYTIPASEFPGTFCFTFTEPGPPSQKMELHITPLGCNGGTTTNSVSSSGGGGCSTSNSTSSSGTFSISNWKTYDDSCNFLNNGIKVGTSGTCAHTQGRTYVVCVDITSGGACTGVEICPIVNCYQGVCAPPPECIISAEIATNIICKGKSNGTATVNPCDTTHYTYLWDDVNAQTTATATGLTAGTYHVKITSPLLPGCDSIFEAIVTDSVCPVLFPPDTLVKFLIPNVITPNSDGVNDAFYITGLENNSKLLIYNRWGTKLFETDSYLNDWDGDNVSDGVYYFILYPPAKDPIHGFVHVLATD